MSVVGHEGGLYQMVYGGLYGLDPNDPGAPQSVADLVDPVSRYWRSLYKAQGDYVQVLSNALVLVEDSAVTFRREVRAALSSAGIVYTGNEEK